MPPPELLALLTAVAFVAAVVSGVLGMAGGILLLVAMVLAGIPDAVVIPAHALVQLASNGSRLVVLRRHVRWRPLLTSVLASLPMPVLGLLLIDVLSEDVWKVGLGALVLWAVWGPKGGVQGWPERRAMATVGALTGTFGVVVGATGPMIAPFFLRPGWSKEEIVATKATSQAYTHAQKLLAFLLLAPLLLGAGVLEDDGLRAFRLDEHGLLVAPLVVAVVLGTVVGTRLLHRVSDGRWRTLYRLVLTLLALRLLAAPSWS